MTDPAVIPFKVANAARRVSPDVRHIAFEESSDHNSSIMEDTNFA
jgi:hypothetical protein